MAISPTLKTAKSNPTIIMLANPMIFKTNVSVLSFAGKVVSSNTKNLD